MADLLGNYEGVAAVFLDGELQTDAAKVNISYKTNDQAVKTMIKGFAGFSNGADEIEGTIEIPPLRDGRRTNWYRVARRRKTVRLEWTDEGEVNQAAVRLTQREKTNSEGQTASVTYSFQGKPIGDA